MEEQKEEPLQVERNAKANLHSLFDEIERKQQRSGGPQKTFHWVWKLQKDPMDKAIFHARIPLLVILEEAFYLFPWWIERGEDEIEEDVGIELD